TRDGKGPSRDYLAILPETIRAIAEARKKKQRRSTSWTKETAPPRWQRRTANSKSKPPAPDRADSKSNLTAPLASQSDSTASKSIGGLTCAVGKSIPHSAVSKCYLESLDQEGGRVEGKVVGGEGSEVGAVDGAIAYPGPIPGKAALDAAA